MVGALVWLTACGSPPEEPPAPVPDVHTERPEHSVVVPVASANPAGGDAAVIRLGFVHLSELYRGFFGDQRFVGTLGTSLGPCVDGEAPVRVEWDQSKLQGRIALGTSSLRCLPVVDGDAVDLTPLRPVGQALARYRDAVAGSFDLRVSTFLVEVEVGAAGSSCALRLLGQHPPDGSTWSPCVRVGTEQRCGAEANTEGVTALQGEAARALRACLAG